MKTITKTFFCLAILLAVTGPFFVGAQETPYTPANLPINTNFPINANSAVSGSGVPAKGPIPISGPQGQGPVGLIANFYSFAFLIAGFLAFVMIVYGGVRYTFSGGSHTAKEEAKDAIQQALFGLGLLLVAYLILQTINPDLTKLKLPTLAPYNPPPPATGTPPVLTGFGCVYAPTAQTLCSTKADCSDIKDRCSPSAPCVQQTVCKNAPGGLSPICASGECVTVPGYAYKNGNKVDPKLATILTCMLGKSGVPAMRITEAMPISSPHQSTCHNNGCCVDMTLASEDKNDCVNVQAMIAAGQACGARVLNEYFPPDSSCGGRNTELSTGVHLHVVGC